MCDWLNKSLREKEESEVKVNNLRAFLIPSGRDKLIPNWFSNRDKIRLIVIMQKTKRTKSDYMGIEQLFSYQMSAFRMCINWWYIHICIQTYTHLFMITSKQFNADDKNCCELIAGLRFIKLFDLLLSKMNELYYKHTLILLCIFILCFWKYVQNIVVFF